MRLLPWRALTLCVFVFCSVCLVHYMSLCCVCVSSTGSTGALSDSSELLNPLHMCTYSLMCSLRHSS